MYYPMNVAPTALAYGVGTSETDLAVSDGSTYPDPTAVGKAPYKVVVGFGTAREEVCLVTSKPTANTLRVTRGYDTSPATAKNTGDVIVPGVDAADFTDLASRVKSTGDLMTGTLRMDGVPVRIEQPGTGTQRGVNYYVWASGVLMQTFDETQSAPDNLINILQSNPTSKTIKLGTEDANQNGQTIRIIGDTIQVVNKAGAAYMPSFADHVASKGYVDNRDALLVPLAGGTMTGNLILNADPGAALGAATKQYADTKLALSGGTMTGGLILAGDPPGALNAATKQYVDALASPGSWTSYSPSITTFTPGNGSLTGAYVRFGNLVICRMNFTFGSTSAAASGSPTISLPFPTASGNGIVSGYFQDVSTGGLYITASYLSGSTLAFSILGTNGLRGTPNTTFPFTWTTGDIINGAAVYEAA